VHSLATKVALTGLNGTLYINCLSCKQQFVLIIYIHIHIYKLTYIFSATYFRNHIHKFLYIYIYIYIYIFIFIHHCYSTFISTHPETIPGFFFMYFNILFPLRNLKSNITVCIYIKGVGTDLFCKLSRPSP